MHLTAKACRLSRQVMRPFEENIMGTYKAQFRKKYIWPLCITPPVLFIILGACISTAYFALQKLKNYQSWIVLGMCVTVMLVFGWGSVAWWCKRNEYFAKYEVEFSGDTMKVRVRNEMEKIFDIPENGVRIGAH